MSLLKEVGYDEQPYEKCKKNGPEVLSDTELLAVFLRTGTKGKSCLWVARTLLGDNRDGRALLRLVKKDIISLKKYDGVGEVKAIQLSCMFELSKRLWRMNLSSSIVFNDPDTIASYYMEEMRHLTVEKVKVLFLNTKGHLIKAIDLSSGSVNTSILSSREIFIEALKYEAVNIVLIHNHPSGDPTPSIEDKVSTNSVRKAGEYIGIGLIDHIIIGDNCYTSFAREGLI